MTQHLKHLWPVYEFRPWPVSEERRAEEVAKILTPTEGKPNYWRLFDTPEEDYYNVPWLRYAGGRWIPDDGECDIAFVTASHGWPFALGFHLPYYTNILWSWNAGGYGTHGGYKCRHDRQYGWHYVLRDKYKGFGNSWYGRDNHWNEKAFRLAMTKCADMHRCANGRGPEMRPTDKWITTGNVRNRETGEILQVPDPLLCSNGCIWTPNGTKAPEKTLERRRARAAASGE